ncbi:MAG: GNAT family N-acetyltransferase [Synergistaceae bacterium]|nr:GNAT family N-acetyltransferase [Synergistaceae bacterium]
MAGEAVKIRAVKTEDAPDINRIRTMSGVRENIISITSERIVDTEKYIRELTANDHMLVAEFDGAVVGCVSLHVQSMPRARHSASLGIMVDADYQRQGIGGTLMAAALDLADNWLMLKRVELDVFVDNEHAISLYRSLGFVVEGTKKYAAARDGEYVDCYLMARYGKL